MSKANNHLLDAAIERFSNSIELMRKTPRRYDGVNLMYPAEIHMLTEIQDNPGKNTTDLGFFMGLSKASVSRMTTKLEKSGYINKYSNANNKKEIFYRLTDKGIGAYLGHIKFHKESNNNVYEHFNNLESNEQKIILSFLNEYSDYLLQYSNKK